MFRILKKLSLILLFGLVFSCEEPSTKDCSSIATLDHLTDCAWVFQLKNGDYVTPVEQFYDTEYMSTSETENYPFLTHGLVEGKKFRIGYERTHVFANQCTPGMPVKITCMTEIRQEE